MRLLRRIRFWLSSSSTAAGLTDEMRHHREMVERDMIAAGQTPAEARDAARRAMGNETYMREESRGVWLWPWLESVAQDATYTLRSLSRTPGFSAAVMLTLALGIGANAAMFSLIDRIFFRPPPMLIDPSTAHRIYLYRQNTNPGTTGEREAGSQYALNTDVEKLTTSFLPWVGVGRGQVAVRRGDDASILEIAYVGGGFFRLFDAPPVLGRYFGESEDAAPSGTPVVVLSHAAWRAEYGSDSSVVGRTLKIGSRIYTIIGVAPPGFVGLWADKPPGAYIPLKAYASSLGRPQWMTSYGFAFGMRMIARRKPGVSVEAASADLSQAYARLAQTLHERDSRNASPEKLRPRGVAGSIIAAKGPKQNSVARILKWLVGVTVIVLLVACANVANLLLARALTRRREIAVRLSLGVSRARLLTQLVTESMVLAAMGGALGLVMAQWTSGALRDAFIEGSSPVPVVADARTLLFAAVIVLGVGVLAGLAPMLQAARTNLAGDLKSASRHGSPAGARTRVALLTVQLGLSVVLLVGAGLFVRSLRNALSVPIGFDPGPVLLANVYMKDEALDSARMVALNQRLVEAAANYPGVSHVSVRNATPFQGMSSYPIAVTGVDSVQKLGEFDFNSVSPGYFAAMGTRIVRGRGFEPTDRDGAQLVLVVGESMAAAVWPGKNPIGQCVRVALEPQSAPCRYVVGVAEDIHSTSLTAEPNLFYYYMPAAQWHPHEGDGLFIRASGDPTAIMEGLRRRLQQEMPGVSYITVSRYADIVEAQSRPWRLGASLFTGFGALALVLAALGLYSSIAYSIAQRTHELGVRMALGATAGDVVRLVVGEGLRFCVAGIAIGTAIALAAGRYVGPLLFEKASPRDPAVFGIVLSILIVVAVVASLVPALRATRVDPKVALQSD
jgi:putative ABC transport system permease protein